MFLTKRRLVDPTGTRQRWNAEPLGMATMVSRAGEGSTYMLEVASFDGTGQCIDAEAPQQDLGGESGLTVMSWVRRARTTSTDPRAIDCDRLIDFGNGQQKENIVINFKEGVRCDERDGPAPQPPPPNYTKKPSIVECLDG